jgi:hypothetical protein
MLIGFIHIILALLILSRFAINNEALIQEAYHSLIDTTDEVLKDIPSLFK